MYVFFVVLHFFPSLAPLSKMPKDSITSVFFEIDSGLENLQKNLPTLKIKKSVVAYFYGVLESTHSLYYRC